MIDSLKMYFNIVGLNGMTLAVKSQLLKQRATFDKYWQNCPHPISLRLPGSDLYTYEQIFYDEEYKFKTKHDPEVIIDAGANIGLTAIYFANKYPNAKIIAIEPDSGNFEMLKQNVAFYENVTPIQGALWHKNEQISLVDPGLGEWGFMTEDNETAKNISATSRHLVEAYTVDKIMEMFDLDRVDILKIDIEGAEKEVFSDTSAWIHRVDAIIAELHERMKPGANRSFYNGTNGFDQEWQRGENVFLVRRDCLTIAD